MIDTHTHLDSFARQGRLDGVLARAKEAGVESMVAVGTEPQDWELYHTLAAAHPGVVYFTAGLHPCSVEADWGRAMDQLPALWQRQPGPVALGECGLDRFHLPKDESAGALFERQRAAFAAQLGLAKQLGCPVVVHSRGAFHDCVAMIDASGVDWRRVVFHCFAEGPAEMNELLGRGGRGSFTGIITYKSAENVRQAALAQGLDRLMLETDAPFLAPVPHRGKTNEPAFVRHTAEYAAALFGVDLAELDSVTTANARAFYGLV